jgi:hypothetical protein
MKIYSLNVIGAKPRLFQSECKAYKVACEHILDKYPTMERLIDHILELEDSHIALDLTGMNLNELCLFAFADKRTLKAELLKLCEEYEKTMQNIKHLYDIGFQEDFVKAYDMQVDLFGICQDFFDKSRVLKLEADLFVKIEEYKVE